MQGVKLIEGDVPYASIVVPTWNRSGLLNDCVSSLLAQSYPSSRYEIVIVDDGSQDETPSVVDDLSSDSCPRIIGTRIEHRGLNAARNAGARIAKGDLICFVDDDVLAPPTWLSSLVAGCALHPSWNYVGGPIRLKLEAPIPRFCGCRGSRRE